MCGTATNKLLAGVTHEQHCLKTDALDQKRLKNVTFWKYGHQGNYSNDTWHVMFETVLHLMPMLDKINPSV